MMTIERTKTRDGHFGRGIVMYGFFETEEREGWFERWFATLDAAMAYAQKRGWSAVVNEYQMGASR